ncbi:hypothetical protein SAMN05192574_104235 [Mucilaginibacter gossypiicola]|uniref:Uncharacterized protein n=1 Tax=Mucilaginibacter gossypiicola TaxID=551995 RepID=A0A1H8JLI2_9SPHI|nr:hypothetical protein SAMN05192574_104235 [Mucilaginibacter gossypiicola]
MTLYPYSYQQPHLASARPSVCNIIVRSEKHNPFADDFDIFTYQLLTNNS